MEDTPLLADGAVNKPGTSDPAVFCLYGLTVAGGAGPKGERMTMDVLAALTFFTVAFVSGFYDVPMKYYLYDVLDVSAYRYYIYEAVLSLPSSLSVFFGLAVTHLPIGGRRYMPYILLGWAMSITGYLILGK